MYFAGLFCQFNPLKLWSEWTYTYLGARFGSIWVPLCLWRGKERGTNSDIIREIGLTGDQNKMDPVLFSTPSLEFLFSVAQQWVPTFPPQCSHREVRTGWQAGSCELEREVTRASGSNMGCQNPPLGKIIPQLSLRKDQVNEVINGFLINEET